MINKEAPLFFFIGSITLLGSFMLSATFYGIVLGILGAALIGLAILILWPIDPIVPAIIAAILEVIAAQTQSGFAAIVGVLMMGVVLGMFIQRDFDRLC